MPKRASRFIARVAAATLLLTSVPVDNAIADQDLQEAWANYKNWCGGVPQYVALREYHVNEAAKFAAILYSATCWNVTAENRYCERVRGDLANARLNADILKYMIRLVKRDCAESRRAYQRALSEHLWEIVLTGASPEPGTASPPEAVEPPGPEPTREPLAPAEPAPAGPQPGAGIAALPSTPQRGQDEGPDWSGRWQLASTNPKITLGGGRLYTVKQFIEIVNEESGTFAAGYEGQRARANIQGNTISFQLTSPNGTPVRISLTMTRDACRGTLISRGRDGKPLHWKTTCRRY